MIIHIVAKEGFILERKIGVIDSGVGGLTVVKEMMKELPQESMIYFGDTARCPYGNKAIDEIKTYIYDMVDFLMKKEIKVLVVACNTATAIMIEELKQRLPIPVIGVIDPGAIAANKKTTSKAIGVIATTRTIESGVYEQRIKHLDAETVVVSRSCPQFVPLIENNEVDTANGQKIIEDSLRPLKTEKIDTLVLGCTHYPMIAEHIFRYFEGKVNVVDPAQETVMELKRVLEYLHIKSTSITPQHEYYVSGDVAAFNQIAIAWCRRNITAQQHAFRKIEQTPF